MPFWRKKHRAKPEVSEPRDSEGYAFIAFDVETANTDPASICQIGIAIYANGELFKTYSHLINPECVFNDHNVAIHGIEEEDVAEAQLFSEILPPISDLLSDYPVVSHTMFDRNAMQKACEKYGLDFPNFDWVDSSMIARRAWTDVAQKGYGLPNLCNRIGFDYEPHDAKEDAVACGAVVLAALEHTKWSFEQAVLESRKRNSSSKWAGKNITRIGEAEGEFFGKVIVFTGDFSISRSEAADKAASQGFSVKNNVSKKTNILVLGRNGDGTTKHTRALELIKQGCTIEIVTMEQIFT